MRTNRSLAVAGLALVVFASSSAAQSLVGALAVDQRQGDQWGWAVDYETAAAAQERALRECGTGCSVVLTFGRCAAYAADQDAYSTAVGWAEAYASGSAARQAALAECRSRGGGSGCVVRTWGCNGPVVEEGLNLNAPARRQIQQGLAAGGFDPGGADGLFGPRTRAAIRRWQSSRGVRSTGYLDGASAEALRTVGGSAPAAAAVAPAPPALAAQENLFWQSIMNSTNPADFEAYLARFPNGVFIELAQNRLAAMPGASGSPSGAAGSTVGGISAPGAGSRISRAPARPSGRAPAGDASPRPDVVFRPDRTCAGQPAGAACWMEISGQPGCYVWNPNPQPGETVTWTGQCAGGFAQGTGTITWVSDGGRETNTGQKQDGKNSGHWVIRDADGGVQEGPYAGGERHGHWVIRDADGGVQEGPYVDGARHGHWILRLSGGLVVEGPYVNGKENGNWLIRWADGDVDEWLYRDGERVR